jgi:type II secretory pathway component GspD/PulD (secretin)
VHSFDFKTPQVNIKAKFVAINRTDTKRLGVSYDIGSANAFFNTLAPRTGAVAGQEFQVSLGGDAFAGVANAGRSFKTGSAINLIYNTTIGNFSLTSFIDALTLEELTDVQSEPSVNTVDKRPALLFVGDHISFLLTPPTAAGAIQSTAPQISFIDVGITLNVTPSISANRTVRLTIVAEQSELKSITVAGPNSTKRQATVEVIVHDGETAVIAGLTQTTVNKTRRAIPLLGTLPVIGRLFSENENIERKDDLLLLITPHILDDPVPPPPGGGH